MSNLSTGTHMLVVRLYQLVAPDCCCSRPTHPATPDSRLAAGGQHTPRPRTSACASFVHFSVHFCPFSFHQVFGISKLQRGNTDHHCPASGETKVECHRGLEIQCEFDCFLCLFNCTCLYNVQTYITCVPVGSMKYPVQAARLQIVSSSPASVPMLAPRRCRDLMRAMRPAATIPTLTSAQQLSGRRGKWNYEFWISVERRYYAPLASCSISYII